MIQLHNPISWNRKNCPCQGNVLLLICNTNLKLPSSEGLDCWHNQSSSHNDAVLLLGFIYFSSVYHHAII